MPKLIQFHKKLNPLIWQHGQMKLEVRIQLLRTAITFYQFLDIRNLVVHDIVLTGSNAAFNYTQLSDLDIHLIVDFKESPCPSLAENIFITKKALWSASYDVTIYGHPVELYVEDLERPATSNGIYSILEGKWIKRPSATPPKANSRAIAAKVNAYKAQIDDLLASAPSKDQIDQLFSRLRTLRQNGLENGGEFSVENLTYKVLRAEGYLDKLTAQRRKAVDDDLSLTENDERGAADRIDGSVDNTINRISAKTAQNIWIEADGFCTCLPPDASHDDQARVMFGENGSDFAFKAGWIRLATNKKGKMFFVEMTNSASRTARRQLGEIIQTLSDNIEYLALAKPGAAKPEQAFDGSQLRQALQAIMRF